MWRVLLSDADMPKEDHLDGSSLSLAWSIPFFSLLLSISTVPLLAPHFWHQHFGAIAAAHAAALLIPMMLFEDTSAVVTEVLASVLHEYIPFMAIVSSLFITAGGIRITDAIPLSGSPLQNSAILLLGTSIASWVGTTGASLLLIRPLIRANAWRSYRMHTFMYFIFLVSNVGGALSPLGDPPLFLGFLKGVDFLWFTKHLIKPMAFMVALLLPCYTAIDAYFYYFKEDLALAPRLAAAGVRRGATSPSAGRGTGGRASETTPLVGGGDARNNVPLDYDPDSDDELGGEPDGSGRVPLSAISGAQWATVPLSRRIVGAIDGWRNIPLVLLVPITILMTGIWEVDDPNVFNIHHVKMDVQDVVRDCILYAIGVLSILITPPATRVQNGFSWFPILEVGKLFLAIFITIIPAVAILDAGKDGELAFIVDAVTENNEPHNMRYFWFTGILSSFLDNAPTFLIFFNVAGGDADVLMGALSETLIAISAGAVFMGCLTSVGNAPNLLVIAICEDQLIKMPSFMGYILWSFCLVGPALIITSFVFFW